MAAGTTAAFAGASCVSSDNATQGGQDASVDTYVPVPGADTSVPQVDSALPSEDAGADVAVVVDSAVPIVDSAVIDAADAATFDANPGCVPGSITGFVAPPYVPAVPNGPLYCNDTNDLEIGQLCADASTFGACTSYATADDGGVAAACSACLLSPEDGGVDGGYGPWVIGAAALPNVAGCIQLADPTDAGLACATAIQAALRCSEYSCATNCPVSDSASRAAYLACLQAAAAGPCVTFASAASACLAAETDAGSTAATWCIAADAGSTDQLTDIARFFCSS
jgi:hypothetical protein